MCSRGMSSPVVGQPVLDQAGMGQFGQFLDADAGEPQDLHRGPGPEGPLLFAGQVAAAPPAGSSAQTLARGAGW